MPRNAEGLTKKQEAFVLEYLKDHNGTQAAIRSGLSSSDDMPTIRVRASENLAKPHIKAALEKYEGDQMERLKIDADDILRDLQAIVEFSMGRADIPGVDGRRYDAQAAKAALEMLGKYKAMWTEKVVHSLSDEDVILDVQVVLSKHLPPDTVEELLTEIEQRILARR